MVFISLYIRRMKDGKGWGTWFCISCTVITWKLFPQFYIKLASKCTLYLQTILSFWGPFLLNMWLYTSRVIFHSYRHIKAFSDKSQWQNPKRIADLFTITELSTCAVKIIDSLWFYDKRLLWNKERYYKEAISDKIRIRSGLDQD